MYVIIYHYISLYIIIYHYMSLYIIICHYISLYVIIYHYISLYLIIYHYISLYIIILYIYHYISTYVYCICICILCNFITAFFKVLIFHQKIGVRTSQRPRSAPALQGFSSLDLGNLWFERTKHGVLLVEVLQPATGWIFTKAVCSFSSECRILTNKILARVRWEPSCPLYEAVDLRSAIRDFLYENAGWSL